MPFVCFLQERTIPPQYANLRNNVLHLDLSKTVQYFILHPYEIVLTWYDFYKLACTHK